MSVEDDKNKGENKDMVSKADLDAAIASGDKTKQELEDMRMEIFSPDYLEFLNDKDKKPEDKDKDKKPLGDEDFEKLTKKELFEKAKAEAKSEAKAEYDGFRKDLDTERKTKTQREVSDFASTHEDFDTYRPIMYGL